MTICQVFSVRSERRKKKRRKDYSYVKREKRRQNATVRKVLARTKRTLVEEDTLHPKWSRNPDTQGKNMS